MVKSADSRAGGLREGGLHGSRPQARRKQFPVRKILFSALAIAGTLAAGGEDYRKPNYDESKIHPYTLEDPLAFADGTKLASPAEWPKRRAEILEIFAKEMYGQPPPAPEAVVTDVWDVKENALAGYCVRKQVKMWFKKDKTGPCINWVIFAPRHAKGPSPVILFLNYRGNHEIVPDEDIPVQQGWSRAGKLTDGHRASAKSRGRMCDPNRDDICPVGMLLARGYAVMSACYCEVSPDPDWKEKDPAFNQKTFPYTGVFDLWPKRDESRADNTTALGAWAWALSRGLDYAEKDPLLDAKRSVVTGCSRLGKAALIAAARDERFAVCVPNQTGGGGAPLAKRDYGENVALQNQKFPHWFCRNFRQYSDNEAALPFDQHMLLACVAPRALYVSSFPGAWFDPRGEFLSVKAAEPVWRFLGHPGLPAETWPAEKEPAIGPRLAYHLRPGKHGIDAYDWQNYLAFTDRVFGVAPAAAPGLGGASAPASGVRP